MAIRNLLYEEQVRSFGALESSPEICQEYQAANLIESIALADSCLSPAFLQIQKSHQSSSPSHANMCLSMQATIPLSHLSLLIGCTSEDSNFGLMGAYRVSPGLSGQPKEPSH